MLFRSKAIPINLTIRHVKLSIMSAIEFRMAGLFMAGRCRTDREKTQCSCPDRPDLLLRADG